MVSVYSVCILYTGARKKYKYSPVKYSLDVDENDECK